MSETIQKICSACKLPKLATKEFFCADKRNRDGYQAACRDCDNKRRKRTKIVPPTREQCADEADYQNKLEWHRLTLDKNAADLILNSPGAKFTKRDAARKSLEQTLERMKRLRPSAFHIDGSIAVAVEAAKAASVSSDDDAPWAEKNPFKTNHKPDSELYNYYLQEWKNKCGFFDALTASSKLKRENPAEWQRQFDTEKAADNERRHQNAIKYNGNSSGQTAAPNSSSSPTINAPTAVVVPQHEMIFVLEDGFHFYPDLTEAVPPLPLGVRFARAPLPPGYSHGDRKISPHYRYDRMTFSWWRV